MLSINSPTIPDRMTLCFIIAAQRSPDSDGFGPSIRKQAHRLTPLIVIPELPAEKGKDASAERQWTDGDQEAAGRFHVVVVKGWA